MRLLIPFLLFFIFEGNHGNDDTEKFICTKAGRYQNTNDDTCNSFFLCSYNLQGELIQTQYSCPEGAVFSPDTASCCKNYTCPRISRSIREIVQVESANNIHYQCENEKSEIYHCRRSGKFANLRDSSCRKYFMCSFLRNGQYIKTARECPKGTFFDPKSNRCDSYYECPCRTKSGDNKPKYSNREEKNETQIRLDGDFTWTDIYMKWTQIWTQNSHQRTTRYPSQLSTLVPKTNDCINVDEKNSSTCYREGLFSDQDDLTCTDYILCSRLPNGEVLKKKCSCPYGSTFNPHLGKCSSHYTCPGQLKRKTVNSTLLTTIFTTGKPSADTEITTANSQHTHLDCNIPDREFRCEKEGRYPDKQDLSCNTYFFCKSDENGALEKIRYRCPRCLTFNPILAKCTDNYVCPCSGTETPVMITRKESSFTSLQPETGGTKFTKRSRGSTRANIQTTEPTSLTPKENNEFSTDACLNLTSQNPFRCSMKGRFPEIRDPSCSFYFLCSTSNNGTFIRTKYRCPKKSYFDPAIHRCSKSFECPCSDKTFWTSSPANSSNGSSKTEKSRTKPSSSRPSISSHKPSRITTIYTNVTPYSELSSQKARNVTTSGSTETRHSSSKTEISDTTNCIIPPARISFKCTNKGRFADRTDITCSFYFLCSALNNGTHIWTRYRCPKKSYFNPSIQRCSKAYICPCGSEASSTTSSPWNSSNGSSKTEKSRTKPSSSRPSISSNKPSRITTIYTNETPYSELSSQKARNVTTSGSTETRHSSSKTEISDTTNCIIPPARVSFKCTNKGRFADRTDITCSFYFLCSALNNGTHIWTRYRCPKKSYFNPSIQRCSKAYICPCGSEASSTTSSPWNSSNGSSKTEKSRTKPSSSRPSISSNKPSRITTIYTNVTPYSELSSQKARNVTTSGSTETRHSSSKTEISDTTNCIIPPARISFKCTNKGRFADRTDITCSFYFLCSALNNGTHIWTRYRCPKKSYFNPSIQRCSKAYICPCGSEASSTTSSPWNSSNGSSKTEKSRTKPSSSRPSISSNKPSRITTIYTNVTPYSELSSQKARNVTTSGSTETRHSSSKTEISDTTNCIIPPARVSFKCTNKGRFPDRTDITCSFYFLCSALNNGTHIWTRYRCPKKSYFDPSIQRCSKAYICPCGSEASSTTSSPWNSSNGSSKTEKSSTKPSSSRPSISSHKPSRITTIYTNVTPYSELSSQKARNVTTSGSTETRHSSTKTEISETTNCIIPPARVSFKCTNKGRFPDRTDITCSFYFLCSALNNGTHIWTRYRCPEKSYFDPSIQRCSKAYICPCGSEASSTTSSPWNSSNGSSKTEKSRSKPSSSRPSISSNKPTRITTIYTNETPYSELSSQKARNVTTSGSTETRHSSSKTEISDTTNCIIPPARISFKCTNKGRFADRTDITCSFYFLCSVLNNGTHIWTRYRCPEKSYFDPSIQRCSKAYICPCGSEASSTTSSPWNSFGSEITFFPRSSSTKNRDSASTLTRDFTGKVKSTTKTIKTWTTQVDTTDCAITSKKELFTCKSRGRFPDKRDLSCSTYFLCSALNNGTLIKTKYKCPRKSFFNPLLQRCSKSYECPCSAQTSMTSRIPMHGTTFSFPTPSSSRVSTEIANTIEPYKTIITTESSIISNDCKPPRNPMKCITSGRFPNKSDQTCSTYILCSIRNNDEFIKTIHECPKESLFNPDTKRCSKNYECSCSKWSINTHTVEGETKIIPISAEITGTTRNPFKSTEQSTKSTMSNISTQNTKQSTTSTSKHSPKGTEGERRSTDNSWFTQSTINYPTRNTSSKTIQTRISYVSTSKHNSNAESTPSGTDGEISNLSSKFTGKLSPVTSSWRTSRSTKETRSTSTLISSDLTKSGRTRASKEETVSASVSTRSYPTNTPSTSISNKKTFSTDSTSITTGSSSVGTESISSIAISTKLSTSTSRQSSTETSQRISSKSETTLRPTTTITGLSTFSDSCQPYHGTFICQYVGRFQNRVDLTCKSYLLCSQLKNDEFTITKCECPEDSLFDPSAKRCRRHYGCPFLQLSTSTSASKTGSLSGKTMNNTTESTGRSTFTTTINHFSKNTNKLLSSSLPANTNGKSSEKIGSTESSSITRYNSNTPSSNSTGPSASETIPEQAAYGSTKRLISESTPLRKIDSTFTVSTQRMTELSPETTQERRNTNNTILISTASIKSSEIKPATEGSSLSTDGISISYYCKLSDKSFKCRSTGRFPNQNDLTCSSYFICSEFVKNDFIKIKHECPKNFQFDPAVKRCSRAYKCPCATLSTTTSVSHSTNSFPSTSRQTVDSITTIIDTSLSQQSKKQSSSALSSITPQTSGTTTSSMTHKSTRTQDKCIIHKNDSVFQCKFKGRFPDSRDSSCSSYFLCSAWKNATFVRTSYKCPRYSYFDPSMQRCSKHYVCPCSITPQPTLDPLTKKLSSISSRMSSTTIFNSSTNPEKQTSPSLIPKGSTTPITQKTTTTDCIIPPNGYKFICDAVGRYANIQDQTCNSYFHCSSLSDGTLVEAEYKCSPGLKFDPLLLNCSSFYQCPCSISTTVTSASLVSSVPTRTPDICKSTGNDFVCPSVGRFPKSGDVSCCTYYSCNKSDNGTIIQREFTCPEGTSFDPVFKTCSDTYRCPCHITEAPKYFSTPSKNCVIPTEDFVCTFPGRFSNMQDVSCCNYFLCSDLGNGTLIKTEYNCPMGTFFDPEMKRCSNSYICPCKITEKPGKTTKNSSTTEPTTNGLTTQSPECDQSPNNSEHICKSRGRFKDSKDLSCSNYILCSKLKNGTFIKTRYACPRFSYFDPSLGLCTTTYKCPCQKNFPTSSRSAGNITIIPGTMAPWRLITKNTKTIRPPNECVRVNSTISEFVCSSEGKFLNPLDTKCTSYVHCVRKSSVLVKTVVNCEGTTTFDITLQKCITNAICKTCT